MRTDEPDVSREIAKLAISRMRTDAHAGPSGGVAGIDLAGDEAAISGARHTRAFELARRAGLAITDQAGELCGPESIREALDVLGAQRIGHGTSLVTDPALVDRLVRDSVVVENCPLSNQQTASGPRIAEHPLPTMIEQGVLASVSTDCRTVSDVDLRGQEALLVEAAGWSYAEHAVAQVNGALGAFLPWSARGDLVDSVRSGHSESSRLDTGRWCDTTRDRFRHL